jgi:quercetin dioxygenase-like cupin family protein
MAYTGQLLDNPVSGERFRFRRSAADTNGELLAFDLELSPTGHVPGAHVHPAQEERFEITQGELKFRKGIRTITARRGDTVIVPPGTVHRFANVGDTKATVSVEVRPALKMEQLLETSVSLARDGRTTRTGMPNPLDLALFMREFEDEVRAPFVPASLVRMVTAPLAWLARRRGLDVRYRQLGTRAPQSRRDMRRPPSRSPRRRRGTRPV